MSAHNQNESVQALYEGDQSKLYSGIMAHHTNVNSPESKAQVKKIWKIFWILLLITLIEVTIGMFFSKAMPIGIRNFGFLALTVVKAGYIVAVFMHLGDELKNFMITVLVPLVLFVWFIIAFLADGNYWLWINKDSPVHAKYEQVIKK